ncbi:MAG: DUF1572 family protein [Aureliella sp.]
MTTVFLSAAVGQLNAGLKKIRHCLDQLTEQQIWWRAESMPCEPENPAGDESPMSSIANLLLHLDGNVRQWLISGLSDAPDNRDRQAEFDDRSLRQSAELLTQLEATVFEASKIILSQTDEDVLQVRHVQEFQVSGAQVLWDSVSHFQGHVQEIVHITRIQLGDRYKFDFTPAD